MYKYIKRSSILLIIGWMHIKTHWDITVYLIELLLPKPEWYPATLTSMYGYPKEIKLVSQRDTWTPTFAALSIKNKVK
jgi:hypothetical protein